MIIGNIITMEKCLFRACQIRQTYKAFIYYIFTKYCACAPRITARYQLTARSIEILYNAIVNGIVDACRSMTMRLRLINSTDCW